MKNNDRVAALDLLRFIAATMVVFYHFGYTQSAQDATSWLQSITRYGYLGVELFFLISGFVILWSAEGRAAGGFARSRFLRLYPMFWGGMAITCLVCMGLGGGDALTPRIILANLTLLPGYLGEPAIDVVYWTLAVELKFYALIFIAIIARQMPRIEYWIYAWLVGLIAATAVDFGPLRSATIFPHGFFFVGGALCYLIHARGVTWLRVAILSVCAVASIYEAMQGRNGFTQAPLLAERGHIAILIGAFYTLLFAISAKAIRVPDSKIVYSLGALTYPLYLMHNEIGRALLVAIPSLPKWVGLILVMACVYSLAWVCATLIEPAARKAVGALLDRFTSKAAPVEVPS